MALASIEGLEGLTLGRLADELGLSKSGVYAHFGSKERLQRETIEAARRVFRREVIEAARSAPEGLRRLEGLCAAFLSYVERDVFPGGCLFAGLLGEYDARPGPLRDEVARDQRAWMELLESSAAAARARGELAMTTDPVQLAFELNAALELGNYHYTLYRDPAILDRARAAVRHAIERQAGP